MSTYIIPLQRIDKKRQMDLNRHASRFCILMLLIPLTTASPLLAVPFAFAAFQFAREFVYDFYVQIWTQNFDFVPIGIED